MRFLKFLDRYVGALAVRLIPRSPAARKAEKVRSLLFIRPGGIGDAVLSIPALLAFRERYPDVRLTILAEKRNCAVFKLCQTVDNLFLYDSGKDLLKSVKGTYDAVVDSEQWHRLSTLVARLTRSPMLIGFATNEREKQFSFPVPYYHNAYEADNFFNLFAPLGISALGFPKQTFLIVPPHATKKAETLINDYVEKPFVAIFPGASISERRWGWEKFGEVTRRLNNCGIPVVVVGGKEDMAGGDKIMAGKCGLNLAGKTSLQETAAVIDRSALLVSGDSGILHIGVGLGKPTVSLFGPGIEKKWAPRGGKHIVITKNLPCSPCTQFGYTPKCPINAKCMADITVDDVTKAVEKLLGAIE